eukprot:TRINITY_DN1810_c0_g1_i1.p1 TRINITY_DN1810_c0_g1~~TRINITY_DN1810_c0_g1_i1.p1  ORF type:complete len:93 (+),score=18.99 TRINITY_DN1810_c0_g1_i1:73-351(+)
MNTFLGLNFLLLFMMINAGKADLKKIEEKEKSLPISHQKVISPFGSKREEVDRKIPGAVIQKAEPILLKHQLPLSKKIDKEKRSHCQSPTKK